MAPRLREEEELASEEAACRFLEKVATCFGRGGSAAIFAERLGLSAILFLFFEAAPQKNLQA